MLPQLSSIDLLDIPPDKLDVNIWNGGTVPPRIGCYAFYEKSTKLVVYIGSACSHNGLQHKMSLYRSPAAKTSAIKRVRDANNFTPLLVKIWFSDNIGDALKYEADAIFRHKPKLNIIWAKTASKEERTNKAREYKKTKGQKYAAVNNYDPCQFVTCSKCKISKPSAEFIKNKFRRLGVASYCKMCNKSTRAGSRKLRLS